MADFRGYVTAEGQQFESLAKQMKYPVTIGFIEIGDGKLPDSESPITRTRLINPLKQFPAIVEQDDKNPGEWVATCYIPADDAINGAGYMIREIGCKLINQGNGILYAYRRVSDDWKPVDSSGEAKSFIYKLRFIPSNGELLTPTIDPSVVLVSKDELARVMNKHKESRDHPYATTELAGLIKVATPEEALAGSPELKAITPSIFRDLAQPRRLIKDAGSSGVSFAKLCDMERDPGVGRVGICALVTGGSDFAGTVVPSYLVSFSTRSYNGSASTLGRHVNVTFLGPGEHSPAVAFLVRDTGTRVELWMQIAQWPYPATMQILFEQGSRILPEQPTHERPAGAVEATVHRPFTTLSPPTAATVGLGAVANFPAASSLEDGSSQKYATAELTYQLAHLLQLHAAGPNHPHATTAEDGMMRIATQEQTEAGVADNVAVTPKTLGAHYKKSNILGAVALLNGLPTGAVLESGSNANGSYMKLANGWMIALKNVSFPLVTLNSDSFHILSIGNETAWPWPARFANLPCISVQFSGPQSYAFTVQSEHISEAAVGSFHLRNSWTALMQTQPNLLVIAIGKW